MDWLKTTEAINKLQKELNKLGATMSSISNQEITNAEPTLEHTIEYQVWFTDDDTDAEYFLSGEFKELAAAQVRVAVLKRISSINDVWIEERHVFKSDWSTIKDE